MILKELLDKAIQVGIDNDPRGREAVEKLLGRVREDYDKLDAEKKDSFDTDDLTNPFADSRLLYGDPATPITRFMIGVDMEGPELLLADRLREKGDRVDLVIAHHPEGKGLPNLHKVMHVQADIWHSMGVPISVADSLIDKRATEIGRRTLASNSRRAVDFARILDIPFICLHTPADNCVTKRLQDRLDKESPERVADVMKLLMEEPEYAQYSKMGTGPKVILGSESRRTGKILVDMTGGTQGPKDVFDRISQTDVGTLVCMHIGEENRKEAEKNHLNIVIAGHIASDVIGLNLLLDKVLEGTEIEVVGCSGFDRIPGDQRKQ